MTESHLTVEIFKLPIFTLSQRMVPKWGLTIPEIRTKLLSEMLTSEFEDIASCHLRLTIGRCRFIKHLMLTLVVHFPSSFTMAQCKGSNFA